MPYSYSVLDEHDLLWKRLYGAITRADIDRLNKNVETVRKSVRNLRVISDLRGLQTFDLSISSMTSVRSDIRAAFANSPTTRYAIYAPGDLAFGIARMYQTMLSDFSKLEFGVFRCLVKTADFHDLPQTARDLLAAPIMEDHRRP